MVPPCFFFFCFGVCVFSLCFVVFVSVVLVVVVVVVVVAVVKRTDHQVCITCGRAKARPACFVPDKATMVYGLDLRSPGKANSRPLCFVPGKAGE